MGITDTETYKAVYDRLKNDGLRLPSNLIVVGTVNMDETTHQFSRKVIDRAMTIEMNIEDAETPFKNFFEGGDALHYYDNPQPKDLFLPKVVQASEALSILRAEDASYLKENVPGLLHSLTSAPEIASCSECVRSINSEGPKKALRVDIVFEIEPIFWLTNLSTVSY